MVDLHLLKSSAPWQGGLSWQAAVSVFNAVLRGRSVPVEMVQLVVRIETHIQGIESILESLCLHTCGTCSDICCFRATVWFDFRDLIFHALHFGKLPDSQVSRRDDGSCIFLGSNGCLLRRIERPFLCTWYVCQPQREYLQWVEKKELQMMGLTEALIQLKDDRKILEKLFVKYFS